MLGYTIPPEVFEKAMLAATDLHARCEEHGVLGKGLTFSEVGDLLNLHAIEVHLKSSSPPPRFSIGQASAYTEADPWPPEVPPAPPSSPPTDDDTIESACTCLDCGHREDPWLGSDKCPSCGSKSWELT